MPQLFDNDGLQSIILPIKNNMLINYGEPKMPNDNQLIERDRVVYNEADAFLVNLLREHNIAVDLERYWNPAPRPMNIEGIYKCLLESAKNRDRMRRVVDQIVGAIENTEEVLFNFNPVEVLRHFENWEQVSVAIRNALQVNAPNGNLWSQFCQAAISGARFLARFNSHESFYTWVAQFDRDDFIRPVLPMLLSYELDGFGFALACDFLLEIGYTNFCKPDRHLNAIFSELGLCETGKNKEYKVFKAIVRMARNVQQTPYRVDKMF